MQAFEKMDQYSFGENPGCLRMIFGFFPKSQMPRKISQVQGSKFAGTLFSKGKMMMIRNDSFHARVPRLCRSLFARSALCGIFFLCFFFMGNTTICAAEKYAISELQKELAALEESFDRMEIAYWEAYFCSKKSQEYKQLERDLMSLTTQARQLKNKMLKLQQMGKIPRYVKLAQDYAVEAVAPRFRILLDQHRLYNKWALKHTPSASSRSALNFGRPPHAGNLRDHFGLSADDEVYLLAVNHRLNENLKYLFCRNAMRDGRDGDDHDCRVHLYKGKLGMQIRILGQDTAEFYDAVLRMRQYLLRTEILFQTMKEGAVSRLAKSAAPQDVQANLTKHLRNARKLYNYVSDDFWCGFFFPNESRKYQTTWQNVLGLRDELRYLKSVSQDKKNLKTFYLNEDLLKNMVENVVELLALLRSNRKITYSPDWRSVGQNYISMADFQSEYTGHGSGMADAPDASDVTPQHPQTTKQSKGYTPAEEERNREEIYQRTLQKIQSGLLLLGPLAPDPEKCQDPGKHSSPPSRSQETSLDAHPGEPLASAEEKAAPAATGNTLILEMGLDTEIRFELRNGKLYADSRDSFGGIGTHPGLQRACPHLFFGRPACLAGNRIWELHDPLPLPGKPVRITKVEVLKSGRERISVGSRRTSCWIVWDDTSITMADNECSSDLYKIKIHFAGDSTANASRSREKSVNAHR